jgi:hypothetical protein
MTFRSVQIFVRTLVRSLRTEISEFLSKRWAYVATFKRIELTRGFWFEVSVPEGEARFEDFGAGGSEIILSGTLSLDETKQIFQSMEHAYTHCELAEIRLGTLLWKTDCRVRSHPDEVTIIYVQSGSRANKMLKRQELATAIASFNDLLRTEQGHSA